MQAPKTADKVLFSDFEVDLSTGELFQHGRKQRLSGQPADVLRYLIRHAGALVSRDELRSALWPADTFVDFDHGLNSCIQRIRQALGDSVVSPRFIETLPKQGYRFIGEIRLPEEPAPGLSKVPVLPPQAALRKRSVAQLALGVVLLLCVIAAAWIFLFPRLRQAGSNTNRIRSLAVLPLKNLSGDPAQEYVADGMTEEVIGRLAMIRGLRVISRTSVMQFKNSKLLAPQIAKTLGVDALVEGSVIREGDKIRVHAQLIRASTDEHFWSETYDRELGDALTLESEVAQAIAKRVEVTVTGEEHSRLIAARTVSPRVYELYLKGLTRSGNTRAQLEQRISYFDEAIRKDPTFAPAYVGLAQAYENLGTIFAGAPPSETRPKVIANARRALELDQELAQPHVELGLIAESQWRWAEAEKEFRLAVELNPNLAVAHFGLADWLLCHGRVEEALAWVRRGRELDPVGPFDGSFVLVLLDSHRFDEAIQEARYVLGVKPNNADTLWKLGWALIFNHQPEEAIPVLEKAALITERSPGILASLVWAYARAGRRSDALRLVEELKKRQQTGFVPAGAFLNCYLGLGDKDQAFAWFERAVQEQSNVLKYVKVFPVFDEVRDDPRFKDLVRRVGLS